MKKTSDDNENVKKNSNNNSKIAKLEEYIVDNSGKVMTTNDCVPINDNNNWTTSIISLMEKHRYWQRELDMEK